MSRDEYIVYLSDKVAAGEIDFSRVRKELQRHGLNETQIRFMIRLIDTKVQSQHVERARRIRRNSYIWVGSLMTTAGLITSLFFMGAGPVVYFIGYGPFATGLGILFAGRASHLQGSDIRNQRVVRSFRGRSNIWSNRSPALYKK